MRVMVTGATGYVGAHSVKALLDAGHRVRLLVRDPDKAQAVLGALGVKGRLDCVSGDMTDEDAVLKALRGCQAVLHCAAVVSTDARRADEMLRANPRGAELVIGHAVRMGLDPVVHVSSTAALLRPGAEVLRADMPLGTLGSGYARSKAAAETFVRKLQDAGAPVVITYPGSVTGPAAGSVIGEATQGIAANLKVGRLPTPDAAWSIIDARDLGAIHAAVMVRGQGPRRYLCGGHYLRMEALAEQFGKLTGREFEVMKLPGAVLRGLGLAADALARVVPFDSVFTHEAMVCFTQMPPSDDTAVHRDLGIRYRKASDTLREAILAAYRAGLLSEEQIGKLARGRRR
ncbi:MAG TPA: NAD-dependent epimerase/dehydratase family protein [Piscinibacter sp.]|jgi:dihydroflavonol-4-reductase|uniref:NAD-dependent epimerase/dehydratase family protein n=1 Tax=Piscinibacter sp. TaxID=1903157 RepID=UPI0011D75762|nr:MAG: NAD-dependent epimerase/dehydratase family protein [Burkholderiaceae bacterium]HMY98166.1 NAD-dependent epimerase/dehydratase family protein [Burkholderiaceae bacterium]HNK16968.1 NAD-dependent epimerase/dehydratase family protein [Piscinibacter sp.]